jgi:hypothetical protein
MQIRDPAWKNFGPGWKKFGSRMEIIRIRVRKIRIRDKYPGSAILLLHRPEGEIVAPLHHGLHQLAEPRLDVERVDRRVQMPHIAHNRQHHQLNTRLAQVLRVVMLLLVAAFAAAAAVTAVAAAAAACPRLQDVLHDEDNMLDELRVRVDDNDLAALVEELLHDDLDLIEEDGIERRAHLVANQLLHAGLEKTRFFFNPAQWVFWSFLGFLGFFGFFGGFLVFLHICPEERVFSVFSVSRILLCASRL